jgi:hypothetical protein
VWAAGAWLCFIHNVIFFCCILLCSTQDTEFVRFSLFPLRIWKLFLLVLLFECHPYMPFRFLLKNVIYLFICLFVYFWDSDLLGSPGWPGQSPASASWMLGLQAGAITPDSPFCSFTCVLSVS